MKDTITIQSVTVEVIHNDQTLEGIYIGKVEVTSIVNEEFYNEVEAWVESHEPEDGSQEAEDLAMERKHGYY